MFGHVICVSHAHARTRTFWKQVVGVNPQLDSSRFVRVVNARVARVVPVESVCLHFKLQRTIVIAMHT